MLEEFFKACIDKLTGAFSNMNPREKVLTTLLILMTLLCCYLARLSNLQADTIHTCKDTLATVANDIRDNNLKLDIAHIMLETLIRNGKEAEVIDALAGIAKTLSRE